LANYDLAIIGSGPGGYVTAIRAAQWGLKTVVIEKDGFLGGTCLHVGCIPTKVLLHTADVYEEIQHAREFGIEVKDVKLDWAAVLARKNKIVTKHAKGIEFLFKKNKVESVNGWGRIAGPARVAVEKDGKTTEISAKNIMLATGSEAKSLPGVKIDGKTILSNIEILALPQVPKSIVVVGAGAVGVEFASLFRSFGSEATLLEMLPRVVPVEDEEISAQLDKAFRKTGIQIQTGAKVQGVTTDAKGGTVAFTDAAGKTQKVSAEKILIAVGRAPKTENLGLEKTKVKQERGFVHVGPYMETDEPGLFAIGDIVAGMPQLAHAASMEGITAVAKISGRQMPPVDRNRIPGATYCEPQIGSVGLTEKAAREAGYEVRVGHFPFIGNGKAIAYGEPEGMVKTIFDGQTGELLGAHMVGAEVTEMIQGFTIAKTLETTEADLIRTIFPHPTISETMHEAVLDAYRRAIHF